jgi:peptide/nickel transport system substrate-binding protein
MARRIRWQILIATISSLLIVVLLSGLALSTTTVSQPLSGGMYGEVVLDTPQQVIPLLNDPQSDQAGRDVGALVFDGLTRVGSDALIESALAESWEVDESGEVYTFRLRRDVVWHDGTPFTANDVIFTLNTIQDESFRGNPALARFWRSVMIDRIDEYTVRCTLDAPYAPFLSVARLPILPAHLLAGTDMQQWSTLPFAQQPVGTGPYSVLELTEEHALLEANNSYFRGSPLIDRIELRFIESPEMALSVLQHEPVQALGFATSPDMSQVAVTGMVRKEHMLLDGYTMLSFNLRHPPLDSLELRQALARGLDKDVIIEQVLAGTATRLDTPILQGWWAYDSSVPWYAADPQAATQQLERLEYTVTPQGTHSRDGEPLVLPLITDRSPMHTAVAREVARQWNGLGIAVEVQELDNEELYQRLQTHDFVLAIHSTARLGPDPDVFALWHSSQATDGLNYAGLQDDQIDAALVQGRTTRDMVARSEHYAAFQQRWAELVPGIVLYQPRYTFVVHEDVGGMQFDTDEVGGHDLLVGHEDRYRTITRWFVHSAREIRGRLR